jgi:hypothetical protein
LRVNFRVEQLSGAQDPAQVMISADPILAQLAHEGGLASPEALNVFWPEPHVDDVAGKHLLDEIGWTPWDFTSAADRVTSLHHEHGITQALIRLNLEPEHLQGSSARQRIIALLREQAITYRVHEVHPDNLADILGEEPDAV